MQQIIRLHSEIINSIHYCTQKEIKDAGYHPSKTVSYLHWEHSNEFQLLIFRKTTRNEDSPRSLTIRAKDISSHNSSRTHSLHIRNQSPQWSNNLQKLKQLNCGTTGTVSLISRQLFSTALFTVFQLSKNQVSNLENKVQVHGGTHA